MTFVYFVQGITTRLIKVGHTCDLAGRVRQLERQAGEELMLLLSIPETSTHNEKAIHRILSPQRATHPHDPYSEEWFLANEAVISYIDTLKEAFPEQVTLASRVQAEPQRVQLLLHLNKSYPSHRIIFDKICAAPGSRSMALLAIVDAYFREHDTVPVYRNPDIVHPVSRPITAKSSVADLTERIQQLELRVRELTPD